VTESGSTCLGAFVAPEGVVSMYDELGGTLIARATDTAGSFEGRALRRPNRQPTPCTSRGRGQRGDTGFGYGVWQGIWPNTRCKPCFGTPVNDVPRHHSRSGDSVGLTGFEPATT
jgi:hypothetical protein